jgi:endonuclease/exonuclease/phosphatase family metal-dependent hydrolase
VRVLTVNIASGRDRRGRPVDAAGLAAAVAGRAGDVLSVQELDTGQPRSHHVDQPAVLAAAFGALAWRDAATVAGTPDPSASWRPLVPPTLRGPDDDRSGPRYGIGLFCRRPVRRWHVLGLPPGRARLPVPGPRTQEPRVVWFPDEPRAAVAAELDGLTVVGTHLSFAPHTAIAQLRRVRSWAARLPGPVLLAGDLNLAGPPAALVARGSRLVRGPTFPADRPRMQVDHLLTLGRLSGRDPEIRALAIGDHRAAAVTVQRRGS